MVEKYRVKSSSTVCHLLALIGRILPYLIYKYPVVPLIFLQLVIFTIDRIDAIDLKHDLELQFRATTETMLSPEDPIRSE